KTDTHPLFGLGDGQTDKYWMALIRQVLDFGLISKDIESYGVLKLTDAGEQFLKSPTSFMMSEDHDYATNSAENTASQVKVSSVVHAVFIKLLQALRKKVSKKLNLPPYPIFQDPPMDGMALKYPITL